MCNVELMQMRGLMVIFPLVFASSAFVPDPGLPSWLRVIATVSDTPAGNKAAYPLDQPHVAVVNSRSPSPAQRSPHPNLKPAKPAT